MKQRRDERAVLPKFFRKNRSTYQVSLHVKLQENLGTVSPSKSSPKMGIDSKRGNEDAGKSVMEVAGGLKRERND